MLLSIFFQLKFKYHYIEYIFINKRIGVLMVKINYCPSCGNELLENSFVCPHCGLDVEELFAKGHLLMCDENNNSIELFENTDDLDSDIEMMEYDSLQNQHIDVKPGDEIVIVVPESDGDEIVIDLDELGIDLESLGEDVNIVVQVEGENLDGEFILDEEDEIIEPNEWYFDDDAYEIVYYEFPDFD